ncbi:MAG TPA: sulfotransferase [Rhizomicrobium sp.]|nr:sulfotransferase [Rhizomicrobium sp.]
MAPYSTLSSHDPISEAKERLFAPSRNRILAQAAEALGNGDVEAAEHILGRFPRKHDPEFLNLKADVARRRNRFEEAEQFMQRCVEAAPRNPGYRFNYAVILRRLDRFSEAFAELDALLRSEPGNPLFREQKAKLLWDSGQMEEALRFRRELAEEYPHVPAFWVNYGDALRGAGRSDECIVAFRKALELDPSRTEVDLRLANLKTYRFSAHELARMEGLLAQPALDAEARASLHFALGRGYGQHQQYAKSFGHYAKGNALRRLALGAASDRMTAHRSACEAVFTKEFFAQRAGWGCQADDPIFILCLPRSGSTLLEQILSSHSAIEALGEIPHLDRVVSSRIGGEQESVENYAGAVRALSAGEVRSMGEEYLRLTRARRKTDAPFFTDKTVFNFAHLGLIHLMLPKAKIIDIRRHPLDCGWSCFANHFPQGVRFSYRLQDIGRHYADYVGLMAYFDRALPGKVHRIIYEDLVDGPEQEIAKALRFLGMPFEAQCLRFYENKRPVETLSSQQVRQPLYRNAVAQWQPYEPWLGPLKSALGPALENYRGGID